MTTLLIVAAVAERVNRLKAEAGAPRSRNP
jgi:hypothetical protein